MPIRSVAGTPELGKAKESGVAGQVHAETESKPLLFQYSYSSRWSVPSAAVRTTAASSAWRTAVLPGLVMAARIVTMPAPNV